MTLIKIKILISLLHEILYKKMLSNKIILKTVQS